MKAALPAVILALLAAPAAAQLKPNSPEAIAAAATDCWAATSSASVDEARLRQLGWQAGSISSPKGKAVDTPLKFYARRGSSVMMIIVNTPDLKTCSITSRVAKPTDVGATAQLLFTKLKAIDPAVVGGKGSTKGTIAYLSLPRMAELAATGSKEQPATRIVVAASPVEKK